MESLLDVKQCADVLRLKVSTIYALVHEQRIPHIKLGRALRFDPDRIREWIEAQTREPRREVRL